MRRKWMIVGCLFFAALSASGMGYYWRFQHSSNPVGPVEDLPDRTLGRMVSIPGGAFRMGSDASSRPCEKPVHEVVVEEFRMDEHEVTNRQFAEFVRATSYITTAEDRGFSQTYDLKGRRWQKRSKADWRHPGGPDTTLDGKDDLPVIHVSWFDAQAYCRWSGKRLPTEAEWEYAARGGLHDADYPWGREETPGGRYMANYWQHDREQPADGFLTLAPVKSFPPNRFGLCDMSGNVWEWCGDRFSEEYYAQSPRENPPGPDEGEKRVIRGGSWLCPENFFEGITVFARGSRAPEETTQNVGFRCVQ